jgi:hypothetical protein
MKNAAVMIAASWMSMSRAPAAPRNARQVEVRLRSRAARSRATARLGDCPLLGQALFF